MFNIRSIVIASTASIAISAFTCGGASAQVVYYNPQAMAAQQAYMQQQAYLQRQAYLQQMAQRAYLEQQARMQYQQQVQGYYNAQGYPQTYENAPINPEMQIGAGCVAQYGVTYAGAGCAAGALTVREAGKCANGVGNDGGCFGPNNTVRKFVGNAVNDAVHGPGDHNDLVGKDGFVRRTFGF